MVLIKITFCLHISAALAQGQIPGYTNCVSFIKLEKKYELVALGTGAHLSQQLMDHLWKCLTKT